MDFSLNYKGGASFSTHRPIFSSTGESIFVSSKNDIYEYNTKTGKRIKVYKGLEHDIAGFGISEYEYENSVIGCSKTGKLIVWNTHFKSLEAEVTGKKLKSFHVLTAKNKDLLALISYNHKNLIRFSIWNVKKKTLNRLKYRLEKQAYSVDTSENNYFSVIQNNTVDFVKLDASRLHKRSRMERNNRHFTCVSCHPSEEVVLTGDNTGRVLLWQNLFGQDRPTYSIYHWHTLPTGCLTFSHSGTYFYSGGDECVLVKWHADAPLEKSFLPRLPAGIKHITVAPNNTQLALITADNAVRLLDVQFHQNVVVQNLMLGNSFNTGMIYDPRTKALVMNGNIGYVQFYSPSDMALLYNIEIAHQNKITKERNINIENTEVTKVCLNKSGDWMATIEERKDTEYSGEIRMKFWHFNSENQTFQLNTSIEYPHENSVTNIAFQPSNNNEHLKCVSVGTDKKFKIWQLINADTIYKKGVAWKCLATGFYRNYTCAGLAFSLDGSLLATGFDKILTTWTPDSCEMKCSLLHPAYKQKIKLVQFGNANQCHLLVAASDYQMCVWNLLTLTMSWIVQLNRVAILEADRFSTYMMVVTMSNQLFVFEPASPKPVFQTDNLLPDKQRITAAVFMPCKFRSDSSTTWHEKTDVYIMTSEQELYALTKSDVVPEYQEISEISDKQSVFGKMLPSTKVISKGNDIEAIFHLFEKDAGHTSIRKYLEAPLQTMAPIRFTCNGLLKSLILQKENFVT